jgi:hypothetical protein
VFWKVGEDIDQTTYEQFKTEDNELYIVRLLKDNEIKTMAVKPEIFEEMYQKMKAVDNEPVTYQIKVHAFDADRGYWSTRLTVGKDGLDQETVEEFQSDQNEMYVLYLKNEEDAKTPLFVKHEVFMEYVDRLSADFHEKTSQ